ncbi:MAG TPA: hypothetical protein PK295_02730 [Candidatus Magasanikbacteria bacterium]|nr:hypothetical protein [Candidatus Magasanikbacteria bacterium]
MTFGTVPEVPAGYRSYTRDSDKLLVCSYERKSGEWDEPSLIHRYLNRHELAQADAVYVYVGDVESTCTREQAWLLVRWILGEMSIFRRQKKDDKKAKMSEVKVVISFEGLTPETREKEEREAQDLGVKVVELKDVSAENFFADIYRKYRPAA